MARQVVMNIEERLNEFRQYRYLNSYYTYQDSMNIHGVSRMEIKHSDFLKWLFTPHIDPNLEDLPLRKMLTLIQQKSQGLNGLVAFLKVDLENSVLTYPGNIIEREQYHIDLLISVNIENKKYIFIIENKIGAAVTNDLEDYFKRVEKRWPDACIVKVFLYNYCDKLDMVKVLDNDYIPITYQDVYEQVLKDVNNLAIDLRVRNIIYDYIHCLASFNDDKNYYMITTAEEVKNLKELFRKKQVREIVKEIGDEQKKYSNNFGIMLQKYNELLDKKDDAELKNWLVKIVSGKEYIIDGGPFNNVAFNGIGELLKEMIVGLLAYGKTIEELDQKLNSLYDNPLFVSAAELGIIRNQGWYVTNNKIFEYKGIIYYVCSSWNKFEYEELKEKINNCDLGVKLI